MTEDHKRLLAVFDVRVRDLMELCDRQRQKINELEGFLVQKEGELRQAMKTIEELNAKCDNMLTARVVSVNEKCQDEVIQVSAGSRQVHCTIKRIEAMDDKFLIHVEIAGKSYGVRIDRSEEQVAREAVRQIRKKMDQYRKKYSEVDVKDLLAMVTFQLSVENLKLEDKNDTSPFTEKIQELTDKLESYLKDK